MAEPDDLDQFLEETKGRQRNIVFPDTVRNGRAVDVFFWRGSPNPTLVQRFAAWMIGLFLIIQAVFMLSLTVQTRDPSTPRIVEIGLPALFAFAIALFGARIFRNGFRRPTKPEPPASP
jgi:hypothetical protein